MPEPGFDPRQRKFALPALVFTALSQRLVAEILDLPWLQALALGSLAVPG